MTTPGVKETTAEAGCGHVGSLERGHSGGDAGVWGLLLQTVVLFPREAV